MTRIHVRRDLIHKDNKGGTRSAALGVETTGQRKRYGRRVTIAGPSRLRPDHPLSCGAKAWIETTAPVTVHRT